MFVGVRCNRASCRVASTSLGQPASQLGQKRLTRNTVRKERSLTSNFICSGVGSVIRSHLHYKRWSSAVIMTRYTHGPRGGGEEEGKGGEISRTHFESARTLIRRRFPLLSYKNVELTRLSSCARRRPVSFASLTINILPHSDHSAFIDARDAVKSVAVEGSIHLPADTQF